MQFDAHLERVRLGLAGRRLLFLHDARQDAKLILDVMADLVSDHVSLGELARLIARASAELRLKVAEERGVEIDTLIARAIERTHGRLREGAGRRF